MKGKIIKSERFARMKKSNQQKDSYERKNHNNKKIHWEEKIEKIKRFTSHKKSQ